MRASPIAMNAAKKGGFLKALPVELYPLFFACGVACASAVYFSTKKIRTDKTLRLGRTSPVFNEKFEEVIKQEE